MFKPETKKPFKKYRERLFCITVGDEGLKNPVTRRAVDKSTASLCSAAAFSVYNSLEQAQIRVNEKSTILLDSAFIRVGDEGFEPPTPCL
jgi:hypothetical protein